MKIVYLSASTLCTGDANAVHVACMCDALAGAGVEVELRARRPKGAHPDVRAYYGLRNEFPITFDNAWTRLLRRAVTALDPRRFGRRSGPIYYGRNVPVTARMGRLGFPVALELHYLPRPGKWPMVEQLAGCRRFLGFVAISEVLRADLLQRLPHLDPAAVLVAHDGFRSTALAAPRKTPRAGAPRAVYTGSFHRGKGVSTVLAAARSVPGVAFHVFGGTAAEVDRAASDAPPNVVFHGRISHACIEEQLRDFDIGLAPYGADVHGADQRADSGNLARWMSPLKIFEYAAAGLAIVTSDLPVLHEILVPDQTALLVEAGNAEALAAAIRRLVDDPELRTRLARGAREQLAHHSWESRAARIIGFLRGRLGDGFSGTGA